VTPEQVRGGNTSGLAGQIGISRAWCVVLAKRLGASPVRHGRENLYSDEDAVQIAKAAEKARARGPGRPRKDGAQPKRRRRPETQ
jgi:hypothetical protein